jgi:hypothetical protein
MHCVSLLCSHSIAMLVFLLTMGAIGSGLILLMALAVFLVDRNDKVQAGPPSFDQF